MTVQESAIRDRQTAQRIQASFMADPQLAAHIDQISIEMSRDGLIISGVVSDENSREQIVPCIRRAGVLSQVVNRVIAA